MAFPIDCNCGAQTGNEHRPHSKGCAVYMGINNPGVRENADGTNVIQMAKRSAQLDSIATEIQRIIEEAKTHRDTYDKNGGVVISDGYLHKINGYMEQIGIIADELKGVGK